MVTVKVVDKDKAENFSYQQYERVPVAGDYVEAFLPFSMHQHSWHKVQQVNLFRAPDGHGAVAQVLV